MPRISLEDRLARLEMMFSSNKSSLRRKFEADDDEAGDEAPEKDLDAAAKDPEVQKNLEAISKSLKDAGLADFVGDINKMMADPKGKLALDLFAGNLSDDQLEEMGLKHVEFKFVANGATPVANLHPTQNEIGFSNSLKKPVGNFKNCLPNMIAGNSVELGIPIITCNGKLIIDGHHRWSQVACVNPDATMKCLDLQINVGTDGIDFQDAADVLKVTQALLAAIALNSGKNKLPSSDSPSLENLYALSDKDLYSKIMGMSEKDGLTFLGGKSRVADGKFDNADDVAKKVADKDFDELEPEEKAAVYLTSNRLALPKPDKKATLRKYMPQTNGGDDMKISQGDLDKAAEQGLNVKEKRNYTHSKMSMLESRLDRLERILSRRRR